MKFHTRLFWLTILFLTSAYLKAEHGPNGYHITSNHENWASFYSTTVVGATTANSDGSGVMLLCNVSTSNCVIRIDLLGFCTHNGTLPVSVNIDGMFFHQANYTCMGEPANMLPDLNQSILLSSFDTKLHMAMQRGNHIEFNTVDRKNKKVTMRASLMGYTAASRAMISLSSNFDTTRSQSIPLGQFVE